MPPKKRKGKQTPPSTRATRRSARSRTNSTPEKVKKEKAKAEVKKEVKVEDVDVDVISASTSAAATDEIRIKVDAEDKSNTGESPAAETAAAVAEEEESKPSPVKSSSSPRRKSKKARIDTDTNVNVNVNTKSNGSPNKNNNNNTTTVSPTRSVVENGKEREARLARLRVLKDLYSKCLPNNQNDNHQQQHHHGGQRFLLQKAEEMGIIEYHLWPLFLASCICHDSDGSNNYSNGNTGKGDDTLRAWMEELGVMTTTITKTAKTIQLNHAAYLLALLLNKRTASSSSSAVGSSSSSGGPLSFVLYTGIDSSLAEAVDATALNRKSSGGLSSLYQSLFQSIPNIHNETITQIQSKAFRLLIQNLFSFCITPSNNNNNNNKGQHSRPHKSVVEIATTLVQFLITAYTCTDLSTVKDTLLQIVGIGLWQYMRKRYRDLEIMKSAAFRRRWGARCSSLKDNNKTTSGNDGDGLLVLESILPNLIGLVFQTLHSLDSDVDNDSMTLNFERNDDDDDDDREGNGRHVSMITDGDENQNENQPETEINTTNTSNLQSSPAFITKLNFLHTTLQLLLDLLSTTSTRRYLRPYLLSINFSVKCTLSTLHQSFFDLKNANKNNHQRNETARLFVQLTTMLQDLETFGIQDLTAAPLSTSEMASLYHERAHTLQKLAHRHHPEELVEVIYAGVSMVCNGAFLKKRLDLVLDVHVLVDLAHRLRLIDRHPVGGIAGMDGNGNYMTFSFASTNHQEQEDDDEANVTNPTKMREFVTQVLLYHHTLRMSELQTLTQLPLYPNESLLWNPHLVPPGHAMLQHRLRGSAGASSLTSASTLALPKLNVQFLTFGDYLLRSFKLLRLESAYGIRGDIVDVIKRMRPGLRHDYSGNVNYIHDWDDDGDGGDADSWTKRRNRTEFKGWARMGLELSSSHGHGNSGGDYGHKKNFNNNNNNNKKNKNVFVEKDDNTPVRILKVSPPKLGQHIPSQVLAEVTLDLRHCGESIRREWDEVGEFDNLFLVAVDAASMTGEVAPLLEDISSPSSFPGKMKKNDNSDRRVPDEEDVTFPKRFGILAVRGCMVLEVRDENGTVLSDPAANYQDGTNAEADAEETKPKGTKRILRVALDPAQYAADATGGDGSSSLGIMIYQMLNVVVRRHGRENNFKAVLETIRGLMQGTGSINRSIPTWLQPVLLGYGDPASASYKSRNMRSFATKTVGVTNPDADLDYGDTFLDDCHLKESFEAGFTEVSIDGKKNTSPFDGNKDDAYAVSLPERKKFRIKIVSQAADDKSSENPKCSVVATSYPFPQDVKGNPVRFTPVQVEAIRSGLSPGLTLIVGPPGTGKTDVAVQIIANLYHSFPTQRTVLVTHSNAALNDLFEKVMARGDIDERYMLRLGSGERDLQTTSDYDFTKTGRVNHILSRRGALLEKVQLMSESLGISGTAERGADGSPSYTCETAEYFNLHHVQKRIQIFNAKLAKIPDHNIANVAEIFPFTKYFDMTNSHSSVLSLEGAREKFKILGDVFAELAEYRPLELLRSQRQRTDYLLTKQARIVAMTCTHAAIVRSHLVELGFQYDNVVMEEAGQMLDIETFIPLLLQRGESDQASSSATRLKRICLIGDHHQLPPVVKNMSFSKYSHLDQSLFTRLIRFGVPSIDLNKQGRARPDIASLYSWRYQDLGNLSHVYSLPTFKRANTGFAHTFQVINVEDFEGRGESTPTAYFYQNVGEAEYAVALFQYMVLIGYPPEKISILTTYNGQKDLLLDILSQRCGPSTPLAGVRPGSVSTVDHYQGQQNDFVILSLVRTNAIGHLRDVRRLVVAVSRARLGLYVFCRQSLFGECHDLRNTMDQFAARPNKLELVIGENFPTERMLKDDIPSEKKYVVDDVTVLGSIVHDMQEKLCNEAV